MLKYKPFIKAKSVWSKSIFDNRNIEIVLLTDLPKNKKLNIKVTGSSLYRMFYDSKLISYGPMRSAHGYFKVDEIVITTTDEVQKLYVEVLSYGIDNFYVPNHHPFIAIEITDGDDVIKYTGNDFECYLYNDKIVKVGKFSYQRAFQEAYKLNNNPMDYHNINYGDKLELTAVVDDIIYLQNDLSYPKLNYIDFNVIEKGNVIKKETDELSKNRYLTNEKIGAFSESELDVKPYLDIYDLYSMKYDKIDNSHIKENEYLLYEFSVSKTGFITFDLTALSYTKLYIYFSEVANENEDGSKEISFTRNDTYNLIYYELTKNEYKHISFEAYTAKYIKLLALEGDINVKSIGLTLYENPDFNKFYFKSSNGKINEIVKAAVNTLAQNSVDVLTDCPSRERGGWLCDSRFSSYAELLFSGKNKVERNFLLSYALYDYRLNLPLGVIPMCYPSDVLNDEFLPNWMLFYIIELYEYSKRIHDDEIIKLIKDKCLGIFKYFSQFENELNLLENLEGWVFVEWSKASSDDFIKGINYPSNMIYARALECYGMVYNDKNYIEKANVVKNNIRKLSYNGEFFVDNSIRNNEEIIRTNNISETCQYYAFFTGVASKETYPDLFDKMLHNFGPYRDDTKVYPNVYRSNAFIGNILRLEYLVEKGYYKQFFDECIEYNYKMAKKTGTLWEHSKEYCSLNHGFTSYYAYLIVRSLTGYVGFDNIKKQIYINDINPEMDYEIKLPIENQFIVFKSANGKVEIDIPSGYERIIK